MRAAVLAIVLVGCTGGAEDVPADADATFPGAIRAELGTWVEGTIEPPDDQVIVVVRAEAGDFLQIAVDNDFDGSVTLMDAHQATLVAQTHSFPTHVVRGGDYYLRVTVFHDDETPQPASAAYRIRVSRIVESASFEVDAEPNDDDAEAQSAAPAYDDERATIVGMFDRVDDVDVYRFHVPQDGPGEVYAEYPADTNPHGSTRVVGETWISDLTGAAIYGRASIDGGEFLGAALMGPRDYLLWITGAGAAGPNDFYDLSLHPLANRTFEHEALGTTGANDTMALADATEVLPFTTQPLYLIFTVPPGDVDYAAIDVTASGVALNCAIDAGSGILDGALIAQLRDASDAVVATAGETVGVNTISVAPGRYYLYLTATAHDPELVGHHVQCAYFLL